MNNLVKIEKVYTIPANWDTSMKNASAVANTPVHIVLLTGTWVV
jgi:hypothetical protein